VMQDGTVRAFGLRDEILAPMFAAARAQQQQQQQQQPQPQQPQPQQPPRQLPPQT